MTKERQKSTPKERLARMLKQSSSITELRHFRDQCRDVFRLGGLTGLDAWIDARYELNLINNRYIDKAAADLQVAIGAVIDAATVKPPEPQGLSWEEKEKLIIKREEDARNNVSPVGYRVRLSAAARMAAAYDKLVGIDFASRGG
nr:hypothetical protein 2 [bacterium]